MADPDVLVLDDDQFSLPQETIMQPEYDELALSQSAANILVLDDNRDDASPLLDDTGNGYAPDEPGSEGDEAIELSPDGILDEDTITQGLSQLGRSADGTQQVFIHLTLAGYNLTDVSLLHEYTQLQKVEIPYNELTDLTPLGNMPYLLMLDASHNKLTSLLQFHPPKNLKEVDLSFNLIEEMADLSAHHYLQKLNVDNNHISEIRGLENCSRLSHLSLAHNRLKKINGLKNLSIKYLNLRSNELKKIENLETLKYLQTVIFAGNRIRSLDGLQRHDFLESIDMEDNEVIDLSELQNISELTLLRQLNLVRNPIQELPDYRLSVLYHLQKLTELDRHRVEVDEKVSSINLYNPPLEVIAARDHIMHVVYNFLQPAKILDSTLPSIETPYPMLILVGPQGSGKKDLAQKLVDEFPFYFGYGLSHTTRSPNNGEITGKDYHFVTIEEFETKIKYGHFLQTYQFHGNLYGLTIDAIEAVAREGLACVAHMEIEGVLTLKNTYFEPRYVLILPTEPTSHERRLRERGLYSEPMIRWMLERPDLYADYNRQHPGFFDAIICSNDITEAYRRLRRLVLDYLGIMMPTPEDSREETPPTQEVHEVAPGSSKRPSKPSLSESLSQTYSGLRQGTSPQLAGRGAVEEASLRRRQSAAKEAIAGQKTSVYDQVKSMMPKTVPLVVDGQVGLGDQRSQSAPAPLDFDGLPPGSPDSSAIGSIPSSSLSNLSDSRLQGSDDGSAQGANTYSDRAGAPSPKMSLGSYGEPPLAPRPDADQNTSRSPSLQDLLDDLPLPVSRPGSNHHTVLPPISPQTRLTQSMPHRAVYST